ncbi:MAG: phosphatase PAP2 family protein [Oscillospiraceae bacterium]|nr:phosphatase PAP2 family protein [Oscillospiraceae bacterium]
MQLLYLLEKIRVPGLNELMLLITRLGEETAFLVLALIVFWCVDKRRGYYVMAVGFMGTMVNQILKLVCAVPRPWVLDPEFTILEQAREAAAGYSFPSGHTSTAVGTFGAIAATEKRRWLRSVCIVLAVLVGFSRMYVGVHTPYDVLAGAACAVLLVIGFKPIVMGGSDKAIHILLGAMVAVGIGYLLYVQMYPFPADFDQHNLASATNNAYTMIGCLVGVVIVYWAEKKWVDFSTEGKWWVQLIKIVLGLALVLAVKAGLKTPLNWLFGEFVGRAVRYFLIVLAAGLVWPMTFRFWNKLDKKRGEA